MDQTKIESKLVRSLIALLDEGNLTEIEYEVGDVHVRLARNTITSPMAPVVTAIPAAPVVPVAVSNDPADDPGALKSPMVGVVYLSPEPDRPRFVNVGDTVAEGQTVLLIEAMKTFNPIHATRSGKILSILVEDGQPVEFGEPLLIVG